MNRGRVDTSGLIAGQILTQGDADQDGQLAADEFTRVAQAWFDALDPSGAGRVTQEEFLRRFENLAAPTEGFGGRGGFGARRLLGFFLALDSDKDAILTREEQLHIFHTWFGDWDTDQNLRLDRAELVAGVSSAMPRTNFGAGTGSASQERLAQLPKPPPSPILAPADARQTIQVVDGFRVELAACEPLIEDPISLTFDEDGRLFVLEMRSFMLDIERTDEEAPLGRISQLEDTDRDGRFDKSTVYVDGLVLPRAVSAVHGGILYVSDYKLYFAQDTDADGKADSIELVDADYGGGNIEHAPNGLMPALDNWIYNARSRYRYRWFGNILVKQPTEHRGQWGITQDNYGRLFYNVNNSQLLGDYTPPNYMSRNPHHTTSAGLNLFVATDQRVFTIRMNTAVNRGYLPEVLDASGKLYVFASSCSPVIYRGDNYPEEFQGNAFVCDSAANLIKRNLVSDDNLTLSSRFAYEDFEFLASTDERFRPVNLFNGPDGTLWVVDMYRGINQYGVFMTDYLRRETLERGLDKGVHLGRIYRIVSAAKAPAAVPRLTEESSAALVARLSHPNGWIRDASQRLLVQRGDLSIVEELIRLLAESEEPLGRIHALWTLEGLFMGLPGTATEANENPSGGSATGRVVTKNSTQLLEVEPSLVLEAPLLSDEVIDACLDAMGDTDPKVQVAAIRVADSLTRWSPPDQEFLRHELTRLMTDSPSEVLFQIALTAGDLPKPASLPILATIATQHTNQLLIREAVVSGLGNWELPFLKLLLSQAQWATPGPGRAELLQSLASAIIKERHPINIDELLTLVASEDSSHTWRRQSLLAGIAENTRGRLVRPIGLRKAPTALDSLANLTDPDARAQWEQVASLFAWPGHHMEESREDLPPPRPLTPEEQASFATGKMVFQRVCAGCHGLTGEGIRPLAAPLVASDWVLGQEDHLIRILLHGLTGPIEVDGIIYRPPIVLPEMPAVAALDDAQIASVLTYIRREWGHGADPVSAKQVAAVRAQSSARSSPWTAAELLEIE